MTSLPRSHRSRTPRRSRSGRNWRGIALGALAVTLSTTLLAQDSIVTNASWNDEEWVHGAVGTVQCGETTGAFATQSTGKALGGSLLDLDLDTAAQVKGITTVNQAGEANSTSGEKSLTVEDAWENSLDVGILSALHLGLTDVLTVPVDAQLGAVNQFAQATSSGLAHGASGYVNDSGGIVLHENPNDYPQLATLKLSDVLNALDPTGTQLGDTLSGVTDLELEVGAVASKAQLDTCATLWDIQSEQIAHAVAEEAVAGLSREYMIASADLTFKSPTVGALVTAIGGEGNGDCTDVPVSVAYDLECGVEDLTGETGILPELLSGITDGLLGGFLTNGLGIGLLDTTDLKLTATVDAQPIRALLNETLSDDGGIIEVNLADGSITIDTAALLAEADPGEYSNGLNGLEPNTDLLVNDQVIDTLTDRIEALLDGWFKDIVQPILSNTVDLVRLHLLVDIPLTIGLPLVVLPLGVISVEVDCKDPGEPAGCRLGDLLKQSPEPGQVTAELELLGGTVIDGVVNALLEDILNSLTQGLGPLLGGLVWESLEGVRSLPSTLTNNIDPIVNVVSRLYSGLFLPGIVDLTFNAQNLTPAEEDDEPDEWGTHSEGPYEVSAIRVGILDALGDFAVYLHLGRASVGPGCSANSDASWCPALPE